jgi:hypothetical protein
LATTSLVLPPNPGKARSKDGRRRLRQAAQASRPGPVNICGPSSSRSFGGKAGCGSA